MNDVDVPSLLKKSGKELPSQAACPATVIDGKAGLLSDFLYPGFYMVFLLRSGYVPTDATAFREQVRRFLGEFESRARKSCIPACDVEDARFAFCALLDEVILESKSNLRSEWECRPLQLEMFGGHMAGERFFDKLEFLRRDATAKLGVIEVFHMCLLLGFKGRYVLEGSEKLDYLTARLGDELVHLRGYRAPFAPYWVAPDHVVHKLRGEVPLAAMAGMFVVLASVAFLGLRLQLDHATEQDLARYSNVIELAPQVAHVMITLP